MAADKAFTMPDRAPLYIEPPYRYRGVRSIRAYARANPEGIRRALPRPLEPVGEVIQLFVMTTPDAGWLGAYDEGGVVIPCSYKGLIGAHVVYEYVSTDDSLCLGREIWGYPKKLAEVTFEEDETGVRGTITRRGTMLIDIGFTPGGAELADKPLLKPRLQLKRFPRVDGRGFDMDQIIRNDIKDAEDLEVRPGGASVALGANHDDPLTELGPLEVLGAEFMVSNFVLDYGQVLEELAQPTSQAAE